MVELYQTKCGGFYNIRYLIFYSVKVLLPEKILTEKLQFTNFILYISTSSQQIKDHKRSTKKSPRVLVVSTGERDGGLNISERTTST